MASLTKIRCLAGRSFHDYPNIGHLSYENEESGVLLSRLPGTPVDPDSLMKRHLPHLGKNLQKNLTQCSDLYSFGDCPTRCLNSRVKCCGYLNPNS